LRISFLSIPHRTSVELLEELDKEELELLERIKERIRGDKDGQ